MPARKGNMIHSLGADFFSDRFAGALFVHNGKVMKVIRADNDSVSVKNLTDGGADYIPTNEFQGFLKFQYPPLGYRRLSKNNVSFGTKRHTYRRGLRGDIVHFDMTPVTYRLFNDGVIKQDYNTVDKEIQLLMPTYDDLDSIDKMLEGEQATVVLNENVIIEPQLDAAEDKYAIYYRKQRAGVMMPDKRVRYFSRELESLIRPVLKVGEYANA